MIIAIFCICIKSQIAHITKFIGHYICFDIDAEIRQKIVVGAAKSNKVQGAVRKGRKCWRWSFQEEREFILNQPIDVWPHTAAWKQK